MNKNLHTTFLPFADFLDHLARSGFEITIDHHVKLHLVLNQFAKERNPNDLKYLIAPIIATNEKRQQAFYEAYDSYFHALPDIETSNIDTPSDPHDASAVTSDKTPKKWIYLILGCLLITICLLFVFNLHNPTEPESSQTKPSVAATEQSSQENMPDETVQFADPFNTTKPTDMSESKKPDWLSILKSYDWALWRLGLIIFAIVYFLLQVYAWHRHSLALQKVRGKKPPIAYPIRVQRSDPDFVKNRTFYQTATRLRERQISDRMKIHVGQTIHKTINAAGFPTFVYQPLTEPPDYLFLINLPHHKDHYAHFIKHVSDRLNQEEIQITTYFYRDDPQICFKNMQSQREMLKDIIPKYKACRLIIMGTGDALLDPLSGELEQWTKMFESFKHRALLSSRHLSEWGMREINLSQLFIVLPATIESLDHCVSQFQMDQDQAQVFEETSRVDIFMPVDQSPKDQIQSLQKWMGDRVTFEWLCACAVYPELHWNLTLYLYNCISDQPLQESSMLALIRLPWFMNGHIPDPMRLELIKCLDKDKLTVVRQAIIQLFDKHSSTLKDHDTFRLNIAIQKWMLNPEDAQLKRDIQEIAIDEQRIIQDYTVLRLLSSVPASPLQFMLPKRLRQLFFKNALPLLGFKAGIKLLWAALITIGIMACVFVPDLIDWFNRQEDVTVVAPSKDVVVAKQYKITITSVPADASVQFKHLQKEFTNGMFLDKGSYDIEISRDGFISKVQSFEIKDKNIDLSIKLTPVPPKIQTRFTNFLNMEFVFIKAGTFKMGSPPDEPGRYEGKETQHPVKLTKSFYMQTTEVTQGQWKTMMGNNPSNFKECGDNCPVEQVSWDDAQAFINKLNQQDQNWHYRLPTEAEWEYSARAGTTGPFAFGDCLSTDDANYNGNYPLGNCPKGQYRKKTIPVASLKANAWGLYDMHGNVWEWCFDYWKEKYPTELVVDPKGPDNGSFRLARGGSWLNLARICRSAVRIFYTPAKRSLHLGFRLLSSPVQQQNTLEKVSKKEERK
jgi:formylglycine-generating enzyme required for sulfatase activity